jgi:ribosome-binding factor A
MFNEKISHIKKSQRESLFFRIISDLFIKESQNNKDILGIFVTRVQLSKNKGSCIVYFYSFNGKEYFDNILNVLKAYKPSLRKAISLNIRSRYTPDIIFKFDDLFEKRDRIENLIESIKE